MTSSPSPTKKTQTHTYETLQILQAVSKMCRDLLNLVGTRRKTGKILAAKTDLTLLRNVVDAKIALINAGDPDLHVPFPQIVEDMYMPSVNFWISTLS